MNLWTNHVDARSDRRDRPTRTDKTHGRIDMTQADTRMTRHADRHRRTDARATGTMHTDGQPYEPIDKRTTRGRLTHGGDVDTLQGVQTDRRTRANAFTTASQRDVGVQSLPQMRLINTVWFLCLS